MSCPTIEILGCPPSQLTIEVCPYEVTIEDEVLVIEITNLCNTVSVYEIDEYYQVLPITNGQDEFILDYSPVAPARSKLFLNGQKLFYGEDYNAVGNVIYWLATQFLESDDRLEIYYY
jgi:hypothetical protein